MIIDNVRLYQPSKQNNPEQIYHISIENGTFQTIEEGRSPETGKHVIDAKERTLAPGFNDSHMHLLRVGLLNKELDLREITSWEDMKYAVEERYKDMEEFDWVFGKGFNDETLKDIGHALTADDLQEINVNDYIFFLHEDGHECVVNHKALKLLEQDEGFHEIADIFKERDESGALNGRFKDIAVHYIHRYFIGRSVDDSKWALASTFPALGQYGITSLHTDDINFIGSYEKLWKAYRELEDEGHLKTKVLLHHYIFDIHDLKDFLAVNHRRTGDGSHKVKVGAIKIFLDGTQRLHTAAMRMSYRDRPETSGPLVYSQKQLKDIVKLASENNMQVAMHAIGDRAVEQAIEALSQTEAQTAKLRHRIIHAQTLGEDLLYQLEEVKPYIETQPTFLFGEWDLKSKWVDDAIVPYCDAFKSLVNRNIPITLSSDAPIGSLNPLDSVFAAVNRTDKSGHPSGGWLSNEKLTVDQAFSGLSSFPADLEFQENEKGKIEKCYVADFVLLSDHPKKVEHENLKDIRVEETWLDGEQIYVSKAALV